MRVIVTSLVAVAAFAAPAVAASSDADPPTGRPCSFTSVTDPSGDGSQVGQINGGPVVAAGSTVTLRCSIHVGSASAAPAVDETAGPSAGVAVLAPTPFDFAQSADQDAYLCTEATVGGTSWYWSGIEWTTDADARCENTTTRCLDVDDCLPPGVADEVEETIRPLPVVGEYADCWRESPVDCVVDVLDDVWS